MNQVGKNPFGNGKGYKFSYSKTRNHIMQQINNVTLKWDEPISEVNKWVTLLKCAYDTTTLEF